MDLLGDFFQLVGIDRARRAIQQRAQRRARPPGQVRLGVAQRRETSPSASIAAGHSQHYCRADCRRRSRIHNPLRFWRLLASWHRPEKIGDPRHHRVRLHKVIGEHRQQVFAFLEVAKLQRKFRSHLPSVSGRSNPSQKSSNRRRRAESGREGSRIRRKANSKFVFPTLFSPSTTACSPSFTSRDLKLRKFLMMILLMPHTAFCHLSKPHRFSLRSFRSPRHLAGAAGPVLGKARTAQPPFPDRSDSTTHCKCCGKTRILRVLQRGKTASASAASPRVRPTSTWERMSTVQLSASFGKNFRAEPRRLALVNDGDHPAGGGVGDRGGFTVVESLSRPGRRQAFRNALRPRRRVSRSR